MERPKSVDQAYLPSNEQLIIAAKVNRICELEPKDPAPFPLVTDAQTIIRALDSRVKSSGEVHIKGVKTTKRNSTIAMGATDQGTTSASFGSTETKEFIKAGVNEYRIGGFVATKDRGFRSSSIQFEPFFGISGANRVLGIRRQTTRIEYRNKDFTVLSIKKVGYQGRNLRIGRLSLWLEYPQEEYIIWKRSDRHKKRGGFREKRLLYK